MCLGATSVNTMSSTELSVTCVYLGVTSVNTLSSIQPKFSMDVLASANGPSSQLWTDIFLPSLYLLNTFHVRIVTAYRKSHTDTCSHSLTPLTSSKVTQTHRFSTTQKTIHSTVHIMWTNMHNVILHQQLYNYCTARPQAQPAGLMKAVKHLSGKACS